MSSTVTVVQVGMPLTVQAREWSQRLGVYLTGLFLLILGFAFPAWLENGFARIGLWQACAKVLYRWTCVPYSSALVPLPADMQAVQALVCISLSAALIAGVAYVAYPTSGLPAILQSVSGLFNLIAAIIFLVDVNTGNISDVGWAMWMCSTGGIVLLVNGFVLTGRVAREGWSKEKVCPWSKAANEDYDRVGAVSG